MRTALTLFLIALVLVPACASHTGNTGKTSTTPAPSTTTTAAIAAPPRTPGPRTEKWIDLAVGECLADVPQVDLGEVDAAVVDCATPHKAEVFARAEMWVDSTIPDVADRACRTEFPKYTGQPVDGSPYTVSYLVDAHQDRTGNDTTPGTAICLLADANGQPLTKSARR